MISRLLVFTILIFSTNSMAINYESVWTEDFRKNVIMSCSEEEFQCEDLCGQKTCEIKEKVCRNCIGSDVYVTHIFRDMGRSFRNLGNEVSYYEVLERLSEGKFATFTSRSIYNQIERFDSVGLRKKFQSLCSNETEYPVVVFKIAEVSRKLEEVQFVICGNQAFEMTDEAVIDVNDNLKFVDDSLY